MSRTTSSIPSSTGCRASRRTGTTRWAACDAVMNDINGVVTRVGDETVGEMWSLYDGRDVLNEIDPRFGNNIANHIQARDRERRVPRLRQHRSEGRPLEGAAGSGPRHDGACRQGDRCRHHHPRREIRDRLGLCRPGLPEADGRRLDQRAAFRLRGRRHRADGRAGREAHRALGLCRPRQRRRTIRSPTSSTRSTS